MPRSDLPVADDHRPPGHRRRRLLRYAVGCVVLAAGGYALIAGATAPDHRTLRGERRTITLPDGSTAELAGGSDLSVKYDQAARRVILHRGQASFRVQPFPAWPFAVDAGQGRIGTDAATFTVGISGNTVTVRGIDGQIAVAGTKIAGGRLLRYGPEGTGPVLDAPAD